MPTMYLKKLFDQEVSTMHAAQIKSNKFFIILVSFGLFGFCLNSNIAFHRSGLILVERSAQASPAPALRNKVVRILKVLGQEILEGAVTVAVESILSPLKEVSQPLPSNKGYLE